VLPRFGRLQRTVHSPVWHLRTLQNTAMVRQLAEGSLDFALLRADLVTGRLRGESIGRVNYRLFIPDQLRPRTQPLSLAEALATLPIATQGDDTLFQQKIEQAITALGWTLNIRLYGESFPQIAQAITSGAVAGLLPDFAASDLDPKSIWSLQLTELGDLAREISFAWNPHHLAKRPDLEKIRESATKTLCIDARNTNKPASR
jgi:DNA-binding transcriptional LysR family regulator